MTSSLVAPKPLLFVIAGEPSGDLLGESILKALRQQFPHLTIAGVGGPRMEQAGAFQSLLPFSSLSLMGLSLLKALPSLWRQLRFVRKKVKELKPIGLLTIDCPEFSLRVSRHVVGIPRIHCVAPSVWAWRPGRAKRLPRDTDVLLSLFPFEAPYFTHMPYAFVGHPVFERPAGCAKRFWSEQGEKRPLLCLLPGSRESEIRSFLPIFLDTFLRLKATFPQLHGVIACPLSLKKLAQTLAPGFPMVWDEQQKSDLFAAATVALAASGTVSLELAHHGTPMVIGYRVSKLTEWIARSLLRLSCVSLINIVGKEAIVPECLQQDFNSTRLAQEIAFLLEHPEQRMIQQKKATLALQSMASTPSFSKGAAYEIAKILGLAAYGKEEKVS
jgi:lipid-A-disaccharide synthase